MSGYCGNDITALALNDPGEYEQLLRGYWLLLGQNKLWWQRVAEAERPAWKACIRSAITARALKSGIDPQVFAAWLDLDEFVKSRAVVLSDARHRLAA